MLVHWIWLAHRPGVNNRLKAQLLEHFSDPEELYCADQEALRYVEGMTKRAFESLQDKSLAQSERILAKCAEKRLHLITYRDAAYPAKLRSIPDPPLVLYYKGSLPDFESRPVIGVVGTRKATSYGLMSAKRMGQQISRCGGIVVSGMALGIDAMAMSGALTGGQPVVGVLGCGVDVVYPKDNETLFEQTQRFGCILSEFPPETRPNPQNFPMRNRIISGISNGVVVIEAPERSGALITANLAAEQGRDVFAVPGNIDMASFLGSNRLLRDGAIMVSSGWDVVSEYEGLFPDKLHRMGEVRPQKALPNEQAARPKNLGKVAQKVAVPEKESHLKKNLEKEPVDKERAGSYSEKSTKKKSLTDNERKIVDALGEGQRLVDDVVAETGLSTGALLAALTMLELKGIIRRLPGKRIVLRDDD